MLFLAVRMTVIALIAFATVEMYAREPARSAVAPAHGPSTDASCWKVFYPPGPADFSVLGGVAASSADDVWAFGSISGGNVELLHFDGNAWRVVTTPHLPANSEWWDIRSRAPGDVWAVAESLAGAYIAHWDGRAWRRVPSPSVGQLHGIAPLQDGSVWAAGGRTSGTPLIERLDRNGKHFHIYSHVFAPPGGGGFEAIAGATSDSLFAGGISAYPTSAFLEQYAGGSHQWVNVPNQPTADYIASVAVRSKSDGWVVGPCCGSTGMLPFVEHWNGSSWSAVPSPRSGTVWLGHVDAPAHSRYTWVSGSNYQSGESFVERYDGTRWQNIKLPANVSNEGSISSLTSVPGTTKEWAVGYYRTSPSVIGSVALLWTCN